MRFTITIDDLIPLRAGWDISNYFVEYDLTKLIPVKYRGRKFMLYSSFVTGNLGREIHACLEIGMQLPTTYNVRFPMHAGAFVTLGYAKPTVLYNQVADGADMDVRHVYHYSEQDCTPVMIDYPELNPICFFVEPKITADSTEADFSLRLAFELLPE